MYVDKETVRGIERGVLPVDGSLGKLLACDLVDAYAEVERLQTELADQQVELSTYGQKRFEEWKPLALKDAADRAVAWYRVEREGDMDALRRAIMGEE